MQGLMRLSVALTALAIFGLPLAGYLTSPVAAQIAVRNQGYIPYSDAPINYRTADLHDPVAELQKQLDQGKVSLVYDDQDHGYLKSVLALLKVPVDSQTLVFSKTSFQYPKITPEHPRALFYNDDVYVGSVHEGKAIEIISFDPNQGAIYYLLDEHKVDKPVFQRAELDCTQCHIAAGTRGIPGVLLRSVYSTPAGTLVPIAPTKIIDQDSPLKDRWGGWYATGPLAQATMANNAVVDPPSAFPIAGQTIDPAVVAASTKLTPLNPVLDRAAYLTPNSDAVALLVLGHQTQMHNLITLTNYKTRLALYALNQHADGSAQSTAATAAPTLESLPEDTQQQIKRPAEQLLRYLLFVNEAPLGGADAKAIAASSAFAREFASRGPRDAKGRSLRDFDLHDRTFRYPLSYLIYSEAFDALPEPAKTYVYHRLLQILTGQDQSADFAKLSAADRQATLSILIETKPGLPAEWQDYARSNHLRVAALSSSHTE